MGGWGTWVMGNGGGGGNGVMGAVVGNGVMAWFLGNQSKYIV